MDVRESGGDLLSPQDTQELLEQLSQRITGQEGELDAQSRMVLTLLQTVLQKLQKLPKNYSATGPRKPGSVLTVGHFSPHGTDLWTFNQADFPWRDTRKPLTILDHVGGRPFFVAAWRGPQQNHWGGRWTVVLEMSTVVVDSIVELAKLFSATQGEPWDPDDVQVKEGMAVLNDFRELMRGWAKTTRGPPAAALADSQTAWVVGPGSSVTITPGEDPEPNTAKQPKASPSNKPVNPKDQPSRSSRSPFRNPPWSSPSAIWQS